jgi:hypothetical protein
MQWPIAFLLFLAAETTATQGVCFVCAAVIMFVMSALWSGVAKLTLLSLSVVFWNANNGSWASAQSWSLVTATANEPQNRAPCTGDDVYLPSTPSGAYQVDLSGTTGVLKTIYFTGEGAMLQFSPPSSGEDFSGLVFEAGSEAPSVPCPSPVLDVYYVASLELRLRLSGLPPSAESFSLR